MPAKVPGNLFGGVASSKTVKPDNSNTVSQQSSKTVKPLQEKISFYLEPNQADKLDELMREYKKLTGKKINRQDVVRRLIENCKIDNLL